METAIKREREGLDDDLLGSIHEAPSEAQKLKTGGDDDKKGQRWTPEQDDALRAAVEKYGQKNWKAIAAEVEGRNHAQCLQRWNKVLKPGLVKGHWSYEEDSILERMVLQGCHSWSEVSAHIPGRTPKQCRERWRNHLDPSINKAPFSPEEDITIQQAYEQLGNRWTQIAELLPGRTEDAVKMRWKALNPNQKTSDKPGRPRLMPGMSSSKNRSASQANPDLMIATTMMAMPAAAPMQGMYGYPTPYDATAPMPVGTMPLGVMPVQQPHVQQPHLPPPHPQPPIHHGHGTELPEPSVEPLGEEHHEVDSNDAAILKELLRSQSNSLLSFGSSRGLSSFQDMSPDELLASGELDEMLKAVSLANEGGNATASMTSGSKSSFRLSSSFSNSRNLYKALETMSNSDDKHIFEGLIHELRANGVIQPTGQGNNGHPLPSDLNDPNLDSFTTSSGRNLLESFEFDHNGHGASAKAGAQHGDSDDEDDFSDLMKPIHQSKRF